MSVGRGVGRPRGPHPNTVQLGRELYELRLTHAAPMEKLVERCGKSRSHTYKLIALARDNPAATASVPTHNPDSATPPESHPAGPADPTLLHPALLVAHADRRFRSLLAATWWFWLDVAVAIGTVGDGAALLFAECGFEGRAQFCATYGADEAQLALLVSRRLLLDLDEAGVALPPCFVTGGAR